MHFLDLYEQQLGKAQLAYYQSEIFHEYCGLNVFLNNFQRSNASIQADVLIDLLAYASAKAYYNPVTFLVYEAVHPVHYKMNPALYFRNHTERRNGVFCRLIAEGTATYLTKFLTGESDTDVFWLGYLKQSDVEAWMRYSEMHQAAFIEVIKRVLATGEICETDYYRLFSVCDPEKMHESRLAYYYGYKIAEST